MVIVRYGQDKVLKLLKLLGENEKKLSLSQKVILVKCDFLDMVILSFIEN